MSQKHRTVPPYSVEALRLQQLGYSHPRPIATGSKGCLEKGWSDSDMQYDPANYPNHGTGILLGLGSSKIPDRYVACIDVDMKDMRFSKIAKSLMLRIKARFDDRGKVTFRTGHAPGFAVLVCTNKPFHPATHKKSKKYIGAGMVELRGSKQLQVLSHIHPDTKKPYTWSSDLQEDSTTMPDIPIEELPLVTEEELLELVKEFESLCETEGLTLDDSHTAPKQMAKRIVPVARPHLLSKPKRQQDQDYFALASTAGLSIFEWARQNYMPGKGMTQPLSQQIANEMWTAAVDTNCGKRLGLHPILTKAVEDWLQFSHRQDTIRGQIIAGARNTTVGNITSYTDMIAPVNPTYAPIAVTVSEGREKIVQWLDFNKNNVISAFPGMGKTYGIEEASIQQGIKLLILTKFKASLYAVKESFEKIKNKTPNSATYSEVHKEADKGIVDPNATVVAMTYAKFLHPDKRQGNLVDKMLANRDHIICDEAQDMCETAAAAVVKTGKPFTLLSGNRIEFFIPEKLKERISDTLSIDRKDKPRMLIHLINFLSFDKSNPCPQAQVWLQSYKDYAVYYASEEDKETVDGWIAGRKCKMDLEGFKNYIAGGGRGGVTACLTGAGLPYTPNIGIVINSHHILDGFSVAQFPSRFVRTPDSMEDVIHVYCVIRRDVCRLNASRLKGALELARHVRIKRGWTGLRNFEKLAMCIMEWERVFDVEIIDDNTAATIVHPKRRTHQEIVIDEMKKAMCVVNAKTPFVKISDDGGSPSAKEISESLRADTIQQDTYYQFFKPLIETHQDLAKSLCLTIANHTNKIDIDKKIQFPVTNVHVTVRSFLAALNKLNFHCPVPPERSLLKEVKYSKRYNEESLKDFVSGQDFEAAIIAVCTNRSDEKPYKQKDYKTLQQSVSRAVKKLKNINSDDRKTIRKHVMDAFKKNRRMSREDYLKLVDEEYAREYSPEAQEARTTVLINNLTKCEAA